MDKKALKTLEFSKILDSVAAYASSAPARQRIREIEPLSDLTEVEELLQEVAEAYKIAFEHAVGLNFGFDDVAAVLDKAAVMSVLTMGELLQVSRLLRVAQSVKTAVEKVPDPSLTRIKFLANSIFADKQLREDIDKAIISETEMSDGASDELRSIRIRIKKTGEAIRAKLYTFINSAQYSKYLQDNIVTVRGDRFVIPVKAEYKNSISGLIHDQSASGQTVYIEPMAVVELNNTLKTQLMEEECEIEKILRAFTVRVSVGADRLAESYAKLVRLDVIFAKAYYAEAARAVKPVMNGKSIIKIDKGRHPLIDKNKVVPIDIRLGDEFDMLLITGPNTGGKTVSIKLVGLFVIMACSGLYVPAREAEISIFGNVWCDIGDEQSIEQNLSTFSSHIANIVRIIDNMGANDLILLDELGAGTDPTEGASLAVSIADYIKARGAKAVITTHYNELKEYAVVTERAENASMDFDPLSYNPTFNLIIGTPGASNALLIAKKLGLKEEIVERARSGIQTGKLEFENVLNSLETARRKAIENEEKTAELLKAAEEIHSGAEKERDKLYAQRARLNENVKRETKRLVSEAMTEANEIIAAIRAVLDDPSESNLFEARRLKNSLNKYIINEENEFEAFGKEEEGAINEGDRVLVKPLKVEGTVVTISRSKGTATVKLGKMNSNFKLDFLVKLKSKEQPKESFRVETRELRNESFSPELMLIGLNSAEALKELDDFLDKAVLSGLTELRVVHGYGTGKLRETVRARLKEHPAIAEYRDGIYGEGERGVTIVKLK